MDAGKLDKRISIFKNTPGYNDYGEPLDTIELVLECWSSVRNKSGKEQFEASTPFAKTVTSFLIRYRKDKNINNTMKINFNNEIFNIIYVDNYNFSNEWLELTAELVK